MALELRQEHFDCGETEIHGDGGLDHAENYEDWLIRIQDDLTRNDGSFVPSATYFGVVNGEIVGVINIRYKLNDYLLKVGGHIGYSIRPSEQRKGYGTEMLALALEKYRELAIEKVLITCDKNNIASARTHAGNVNQTV